MTQLSAFDLATDKSAVVFQDKPLVHLSPWLARSYVAASAAGKRFVVLTPGASRITHPLAGLLSTPGCQWLVTTEDGGFFDGFTGQLHTWDADGFSAAGVDAVADDFLLTSTIPSGYVEVRAETIHPASTATRIGVFTEKIFRQLTHAAPVGWGLHEPASEPWNPDRLTMFCFDRAPKPTQLVVVGQPRRHTDAPSIATVRVERTAIGVHESVQFLTGTADPLDREDLDSFGAMMHQAHARTAVLGHGLGYQELGRPARFTGATVPGCAVFGPEALRTEGADQALNAAGPRARLVGISPARSLVITYASEPVEGEPHPLEAYGMLAAKLAGQRP